MSVSTDLIEQLKQHFGSTDLFAPQKTLNNNGWKKQKDAFVSPSFPKHSIKVDGTEAIHKNPTTTNKVPLKDLQSYLKGMNK